MSALESRLCLQVSQLASSLQLSGGAGSGGSQGDTELQRHFEEVQAQLVKTHGEREKDLLDALDSMQERQVALRTHVKALALGYRNLRYQVEDAVARGDAALPVKVVHENQLLGEAPNNVLANDEVSLRGIHMHTELYAQRYSQLHHKRRCLSCTSQAPSRTGRDVCSGCGAAYGDKAASRQHAARC